MEPYCLKVTFGAASPIVIPADLALTTAGAGVATHGAFVWYNTVQNSIDTLQRFQYSFGKSGERVMQTVKPNYKDYVKAEKGQRPPNFTLKELREVELSTKLREQAVFLLMNSQLR